MKKAKIIYWVFTGLLAALMLFSGIMGVADPVATNALISTHLGYPEYFAPLISIAKIAGVVAILIPGFPRLKEWAYAGFTFDIGMAIYSFIAVGDPVSGTSFLFFGLILIFGSYISYHRKKRLATAGGAVDVIMAGPEMSMD